MVSPVVNKAVPARTGLNDGVIKVSMVGSVA